MVFFCTLSETIRGCGGFVMNGRCLLPAIKLVVEVDI